MYIGLSGGIGSGKTTVAKMLGELGAVVIDADAIAREVLQPGQDGYTQAVAHFGEKILDESRRIDRQALAKVVFDDEAELKVLESIVHPAVIARVTEIRQSLPESSTVVYDTPLLAEKNMQAQFDVVIMVISNLDLRKKRLLDRGLSADDIESRIANQVSDENRVAVADYVLENNGSIEELKAQVSQAWSKITA